MQMKITVKPNLNYTELKKASLKRLAFTFAFLSVVYCLYSIKDGMAKILKIDYAKVLKQYFYSHKYQDNAAREFCF